MKLDFQIENWSSKTLGRLKFWPLEFLSAIVNYSWSVYLKFLSSFISNKKYANETNFTTNLPLCGVKETINPDGP